jgi:hypothetical protein
MLRTKVTKIKNNLDFDEEIIDKNNSEFSKGVIFSKTKNLLTI